LRTYETVYILDPTLESTSIDTEIEKFNSAITSYGGNIVKQDKWGVRNLAYPIAKRSQGFYVVTLFEGNRETLTELDRAYRLDEQVLRHLTIVMEKKQLQAVEKAKEAVASA
jgi:small subunit ribosomal protein S6